MDGIDIVFVIVGLVAGLSVLSSGIVAWTLVRNQRRMMREVMRPVGRSAFPVDALVHADGGWTRRSDADAGWSGSDDAGSGGSWSGGPHRGGWSGDSGWTGHDSGWTGSSCSSDSSSSSSSSSDSCSSSSSSSDSGSSSSW